jgi:hypothetical protein
MKRKIEKSFLGVVLIYFGTLYLLFMIPTIIKYLTHRLPDYPNPVAYLIFNGIVYLFTLVCAIAINTGAFLFTAKLF